MKMSRTAWFHVFVSVSLALAALLLIRLHYAGGAALSSDSASDGHRLAEAWCKDCHAIEATTAGTAGGGEYRASLPRDRQPAFDHRAFTKSVSSVEPPKHAQSRDHA